MREVMLLATVLVSAMAAVAGPEPQRSEAPVSIVEAPSPPGALAADPEDAEAIRMRNSQEVRSSRRLYQGGLYSVFGGLGLVLLSPELTPALAVLGGIAFASGELMMGIGADQLNRFARGVPGHVDPGSGWGFYGAAWGLKMGGSLWLEYVILSNFELAGPRQFFLPYSDATWEEVALPLATIATGFLCDGVALYKFHARQKAARAALTSGLSWSPTLRRDSRGGFQGGLSLTMGFE